MPKTSTRTTRTKGTRGKSPKRRTSKKTTDPQKDNKLNTLANLGNLNEDDAEVDLETLVREEHKRLLRQYRLMEDTRHHIVEKEHNLTKKSKIVDLLRAEKEDLLTDLVNAECEPYKERDRASTKTILTILREYEICLHSIDNCWKNIKEMESNVDKITVKLVEQKLKVQALYGQSMTVAQSEHRQRILENRLYHVTTQFDSKVSMNKELREEINMMLKLRGIFFERMIYIKKQCNRIKRRMGEIVYLATQAYDQRDDWVTKIHTLRDKNEKDSKQHVLEIKEFNRILHGDSKLHGFMTLKNMERKLMESATQRNDRKNQAKLSELDHTLAAYQSSFKEIIHMGESSDIEHIVGDYLGQEQLNFSRFRYITDVNYEINSLRGQNIAMAREIQHLYNENKKRENSRQQELKDLSLQYEFEVAKLDTVMETWEKTEVQMNEVIHLMDVIFLTAKCSNTSIIRLLGNLNGISPRNAGLCLRVVENRVAELLFEKAKYEVRKSVEIDHNQLPKKTGFGTSGARGKQAGGPFSPNITVTGRLDGEQEEDEEDKVFSERPIPYSEMKKRVLDKLANAPNRSRISLATGTGAEVGGERGSVISAESTMMIDMNPSQNKVKQSFQIGDKPEAPK